MIRTADSEEDRAPEGSESAPRRAARSAAAPETAPAEVEVRESAASSWAAAPEEYEDEAPGAYLRELGVAAWNVVWAAVNLALTLAVGLCRWFELIAPDWQFAAAVAWKLLPMSGVLLLLVTLWQSANAYSRNAPGLTRLTAIVAGAALILWFVL